MTAVTRPCDALVPRSVTRSGTLWFSSNRPTQYTTVTLFHRRIMVAPSGKSGPKDQVALQVVLLYFAFALVHDSRGIEIATWGKSGPALGGTEYRLMPSACRLIVRAKL